MWKWLVGIFVLLAVLCGVGGYFASQNKQVRDAIKKFQGKQDAPSVKLEAITRGDLTRSISAPGAIDPRAKVKVTARVSSTIIALPLKEGQDVKEGDVIVRLDSEDPAAALDQARADLRAQQAQLEGVQVQRSLKVLELERARALFASKDTSKADLDRAEAEVAQLDTSINASKEAIARAEAAVRRAQRDLDNTVITSPTSGTIIKLNSEVGEVVLGTFNNAGTEIMEIADLNTMLMRAEIDENNIEPIKPGQRATVYINAYPERKFTGIVERLKEQNQISREGKQYFEAEILLDLKGLKEGERLKAGLKANCDIQVETKYDVMKVPTQAVLDRRVDELGDDAKKSPLLVGKNKAFARVVFTVVDGKARAIPVETGSSDLTSTVILSGIDPNTRVITGPYKVLGTLKEGAEVREEAAAEQKPDQGGPNPKPDGKLEAGAEAPTAKGEPGAKAEAKPAGGAAAESKPAPDPAQGSKPPPNPA